MYIRHEVHLWKVVCNNYSCGHGNVPSISSCATA